MISTSFENHDKALAPVASLSLPESLRQGYAALAFRKSLIDSAITVLEETAETPGRNSLLERLKIESVETLRKDTNTAPAKVLGKKGELAKELAQKLSEVTGKSAAELEAKIRSVLVMRLNNADWAPVGHEFKAFTAREQSENVGTSSVPMNEYFSDIVPGAAAFRQFMKKGRTSASLKAPLDPQISVLVPNGWYTRLTAEDGRVLLDGFRTGSLVNYGEKDIARLDANTAKNAETLLLAVSLKALNSQTEEEKAAVLKGERPLKVRIACFDLQSRESPGSKLLEDDLEGFTIDRQRDALLKLAGVRSLTFQAITPDGSPIRIPFSADMEILTFNYPVVRKSFIEQTGWGEESQARNKEAIDILFTCAEKHLKDYSCSTEVLNRASAEKIKILLEEVKDIYKNRRYSEVDFDPYKMNSRLLNLAWLCGYEIQFNCRSGKDRTGFLEGEAKLTALQLELMTKGGLPPSCRRELTPEESDTLYTLLVHGGSFQIQKLNTGIPGSKVPPATFQPLEKDWLVRRVGGAARWLFFKGLSQYADT